ncbi:MAG: HAMP domain-containing histidine kinase [Oscillospiraceae bacterium]|nr:HAMP domain-containing histidine kinase [Oscillospiraceae bacterium]
MMMWWIACGLLAIGFAILLIRLMRIKNDIRQLGEHLSEIAYIDTNARLVTRTFDRSVSSLIQSINAMLKKNRRDHFEAQRTETELKRAITNISHDLRTPLTAARGYLQMLEASDLDPATRAQYTGIIRGRLDNLGVLMSDLFEFARIIEGNTTLDIQQVNIANTLRDALSEAHRELEYKGFRVDIDIPDTPVVCQCDPDALRRVLQNLLKNVCIHGKAYLCVRLTGNQIEIANQADDLDKIDVAHMFERFYTSDTSRSNKNTGLGLAIAKELTAQMDGKLTASKEDNMLTMRIVLPQKI